jgi:hypothetical protein
MIDEFYETKQTLIKSYDAGIKTLFDKLATKGSKSIKSIVFEDFISYMQAKHIRITKEKVVGICLSDSEQDKISYVSLVKLLLLACCSGDK